MNNLELLNRQYVFDVQNLIEEHAKTKPEDIVSIPVEHYFSHGIYARQIFIPKDTVVVGELHKYPQLNVLLAGDISVMIGDHIERIKPPFVVCSPAGTKRIAYAHEDTWWLTIHATEDKNVGRIEKHFIAKTEQEYLDFIEQELKIERKQQELLDFR